MANALRSISLSQIKSRLLNVSQTSLYELTLGIPEAVRRRLPLTGFDYDSINLMCAEASLPGSSLATHAVENDYHGVSEQMAYRRIYDETIGLTFYVDRNYKIIELLEGWMDYISGMDNTRDFKSPYAGYRMAYPNTYKQDIFLTKFEKDHFSYQSDLSRTTLHYTFVNAFPLSLTAMPVSYEDSQILRCSVSFNFIRYVTERKTSVPAKFGGLVNTG